MGDSLVGRQSDAKTFKSHSETALLADWNDLEKTAVKASDNDITNITKSLQAGWTDISTLAKVACLDAQVNSKSTLDGLAGSGPVKIDAATKLAYQAGEISIQSIATKVGNVGASLVSWFFGKKDTDKPDAGEDAKATPSKASDKAGSSDSIPANEKPGETKPSAKPSSLPAAEKPSAGDRNAANKPAEHDESNGLTASVLRDIEPEHLRHIFETIFSKESTAASLASLPAALVHKDGIIFGVIDNISGMVHDAANPNRLEPTVSSQPAKPADVGQPAGGDALRGFGAPELKIEDGTISYISADKSVQLHRHTDGNLAATVENKVTGTAGDLFADLNGLRIYTEGKRPIFKFIDPKHFEAGEFTSDGATISQTKHGKKLLVASKTTVAEFAESMTFIADNSGAKSLEAALKNIKNDHPEAFQQDNNLVVWYQNGGAVVNPSEGRVLEFRHTPDGTEFYYDLGDGTQLLFSPKGKLYLVADQSVKELSDEQTKQLVDRLGTAKGALLTKLLADLKGGQTIELPGGQQLTIDPDKKTVTCVTSNKPSPDGKARKTEVHMNADGWKIDTPIHSATFVEKTGELTTESEGKPVSINLKSEKLDMLTSDFSRKDGEVTFVRTNIKIKEDGAVDLPDGTKINARNDVRFADGSKMYRDGTLVSKDGTVITDAPNLPQKPNLDAFVSQALSMAASVASRVQSGSCSPADIALIEANMSVVQNFINLFSIAGNLPIANSLYQSWSMLKESYGKAQNETGHNLVAEKTREDEVRSFLTKLALENSQTSSRPAARHTDFVPSGATPSLVH